MKQELKDKWVAALRSGEYEQGMTALRTADNRFCCLGVLCDVAGGGEWKHPTASPYAWEFHYRDDDSTSYLPDPLRADLGLAGTVWSDGPECILAGKNDKGATFAELADWIEANIVGEP